MGEPRASGLDCFYQDWGEIRLSLWLHYGRTGIIVGEHLSAEIRALTTYKSDCSVRMRALRLRCFEQAKIVAQFQFEAVLGKTRRTEF